MNEINIYTYTLIAIGFFILLTVAIYINTVFWEYQQPTFVKDNKGNADHLKIFYYSLGVSLIATFILLVLLYIYTKK
jgi:hypothetical protein